MALPTGMICRTTITVKGKKLYAADYGLRAFCFFPSKGTGEIAKLHAKKVTKKTASPLKSQS